MQITYSTINDFHMYPDALTLTLNASGNKDLLSAAVYSGAKVTVFKKEAGVEYTPAKNYRQWTIVAYATYFEDSAPRYAHLAVSRNSDYATVVYPSSRLDFYGNEIVDDCTAYREGVIPTQTGDNWYVFLGKIEVNPATRLREWSIKYPFVTGELDTDQYRNNVSNSFVERMFSINEVTQSIVQQLPFSRLLIGVVGRIKTIVDVWLSTDQGEPTNGDEVIVSYNCMKSFMSDKFISKVEEDSAAEVITFEKGLETGNYVNRSSGSNIDAQGNSEFNNVYARGNVSVKNGHVGTEAFNTGLLGNGWRINKEGHAEMDSLSLRKFLEVPELRFNRTTVFTGIQWHTVGAGLIEEVICVDEDGKGGIIKLKLEDGEYGAVAQDDLCMGIFHNEGGGNSNDDYDGHDGNFTMKGFQTIYFKIDYICDENGNSDDPDSRNQYFHYTLREQSDSWIAQHQPQPSMSFACYANPTNSARQCSVYSTTGYTIMLVGMVDWTYNGNNISLIEGNLNGFTIPASKLVDGQWTEYMQELNGYGLAFGNAYMWGKITQFTRDAYLVTQKPRYFASSESLEVVLSKWNAGTYTKDNFSEDSIKPTSAKPNVYIIFEYTYSNESKSYSDPTLFSMYGVAGKDGKPGAQPNLYGYGTTFIEADSNVIAHHKSSGFVVYRGSKGSYLTINGLNIFPDTDYACSFDADTTAMVTIELYGKNTFLYPSKYKKDGIYWGRYVCKIHTGDTATDGREFALAFDQKDKIINVQNFKIEKSTEATEYDGLAQDDLTPVNLLHGTGDFNGWTINSKYAKLWEVGAIGNKAVYVDSYCKEVFLSYAFSQKNLYIKRNRWHILSWYSCSGSITTDASKNYSYVVSIKGLTPDQLITTDGYTYNISTSSFVFSDNNDWVRHYIIFRATAFDSQNIITIEVQRLSSAYSGYFSSPMLELGDKLNHWQPAEIDRKGKDGTNVEISSDGYWVLDGKKTDFSAEGDDGHSPYINGGYWYEWDTDKNQYHNTGIKAEGEDGQSAYSVNLSSDTVTIPLSKDGTLLEIVDYTIYIDAYKGNKRINVKKIDFEGTDPLNKYFFIIVNDDEYTVDDNCIQFYSRPVSFEEFRDISYWCEITVEDEDGVQAIFYRYINFVKNRQGRDGVSPVSLQLDVNTIVFPTMDGNISEGAIERRITAIMLSGTTSFPTSISSATMSDNNGLTVRTDGNEVVVTPQVGSAWGNDRTLTIVAAASVKGETIVMTATVNVVGSAQGQTVTGPQGASFSGMVEQFQATASKDVSSLVDDAWSNTHIEPTATLPYVWNREIVSIFDPKTSQTTTQMTEPHICCEFADGIVSHSSKYAVNNSNVAPSDAAFDEYGEDVAAAIASMNNTDRRFLWNWEVSTYKDASKNSSVKRLVAVSGRDGEDGKDGIDGVDGNDGNGILSVSERYSYGTESAPVGTWYTTAIMPLDEDGKRYVWNKEVISYTNGEEKDLVPHIIARYTKDGKGILSYSTTYAVTNTPEVPSSFPYNNLTTAVSYMSSNNQYLWEKEITYFTDGTDDDGEIRLISVYGESGDPGTPGEDGRDGTSIKSVNEQYAYGTETAVTGAWQSAALKPTAQNPYVWNREVVTFVDADGVETTSYLTEHIIARYVSDGRGVAEVSTMYEVTSDNLAPTTFRYDRIENAVAQMSSVNKFLWEQETITYTSGAPTVTIRLVAIWGQNGTPGVNGADAVQPNIFGYDCALSGIQLGSSLMHTDNGLVAFARKVSASTSFSVSIDLSKKVKRNHSYAVHGYILSPASGELSVYFSSGVESKSNVNKNSKIAFYALLEAATDILTLKVTPVAADTNYSGCFELSELKIEDMTGLNSTKTVFEGLSSYEVPRGENILRNIMTFDGWTKHNNVTVVKDSFQGQSAVTFGSVSSVKTQYLSCNVTLKANTSYTLSWWDNVSGEGIDHIAEIMLSDRSKAYTVSYSNTEGVISACPSYNPYVQFRLKSDWTYRTLRFRTIGDVSAILRFFSVGVGTIFLSKLKLEEGDCNTEWIESPEDRKGLDGCVIRSRGEWNENTVYVNESNVTSTDDPDGLRYIDIVQYKKDNELKFYQRNTFTSGYRAGIAPSNSTYWTEANTMDFVASKVLMSEEAWVNALTGKSIYVTDKQGNVCAGMQSTSVDDTPQMFAGSDKNSALDAAFRVYSDGRVVLNKVDINSADEDENRMTIGNGSLQVWDKNGKILTTISQITPTSLDNAVIAAPTQTTSTKSGNYQISNNVGTVNVTSTWMAFSTTQHHDLMEFEKVNADGGILEIPSITVPVTRTLQIIKDANCTVVLNTKAYVYIGTELVTSASVSQPLIGSQTREESETVYLVIPVTRKSVTKGKSVSASVVFESILTVIAINGTNEVSVPDDTMTFALNSIYTASIKYDNYQNQIMGNGFVFAHGSDQMFAYVGNDNKSDEALRLMQGNYQFKIKNQMAIFSGKTGASYYNANPVVFAARFTLSGTSKVIDGVSSIFNPLGLAIERTFSASTTYSETKLYYYSDTNGGSYTFIHGLAKSSGNYLVQVSLSSSAAKHPTILSQDKNKFVINTYNSSGSKSAPASIDIVILDCSTYS